MTDKRKSWWSEVSNWDDHVEKGWIQWIELVAGLCAMIVLTLSLLAVWDGNCFLEGTMNQRLLVLPHGISRHPLRSAKFKLSAVESLSASKEGGWRMRFREEPVTPVYRHWMCEQVGCNGELLSTGEGITRLSTRWKHRCGKCGHEDWADATYPRVAYLPIDAIGPDDSYT